MTFWPSFSYFGLFCPCMHANLITPAAHHLQRQNASSLPQRHASFSGASSPAAKSERQARPAPAPRRFSGREFQLQNALAKCNHAAAGGSFNGMQCASKMQPCSSGFSAAAACSARTNTNQCGMQCTYEYEPTRAKKMQQTSAASAKKWSGRSRTRHRSFETSDRNHKG